MAQPADTRVARSLQMLAISLLMGLGAVFFLRQPWAREHQWTWIFLLVPMFTAAAGLRGLELWLPGQPILPRLAAYVERRDRTIGLACIGLGLVIAGWLALRLWPDYHDWQGTVLFWVMSMALVLVGAWFLRAVGRGAPRAATAMTLWPDTRRNRWLEAGAFVLILALAILLRTYRFNDIPAGIYVDETNGALDALYLNEGRAASPFGTGWYGTPNGYLYYMAGMFQLFGANWFSLKLVSLIPAILTIPAVYLLGRLMFGPLAGISAMLLMAASRWHLSMSRWGWNETAPPFFQVLSFFFLIRGLRDRRALDYALSGLLMGLSIYTYLSARLALATMVLYILYWVVSDPSGWRASLHRSSFGLALVGAGFLAAVTPIGVTYATDTFAFQNRVSQISIFRDVRDQGSYAPLTANITDILKFFHQTGDHQGKHNLPDEPMADPITGLLFAVGLAYAILAWRDQRRILLLLWLVLGLAGSYLSSHHESPQSYRALTALPAVVLMAADALDRVGRAVYRLAREGQLSHSRPYLAAFLAGLLVVTALGCAAAWESNVYFGRQAASIDVIRGFNPTENSIAKETIAALRRDQAVYLSPDFSTYAPLRFLVYGVVKAAGGESTLDNPPWRVAVPEVNLPLPDTGQDALVLLDTSYWQLRDFIASLYPDATMQLATLADGSPIYMRVEVPHEQIAGLQGLTERATFADGQQDERVVPRVDLTASEAKGADVEWDGAIRLDHGGEVEFRGEGGLEVFIEGEPVEGPRYLGRGLYALHLVRPMDSRGDARLLWRVGEGDFSEVPPEALFRLGGHQQGLTGQYWNNMNWEGEPLFQQVTPFLMLAWPDEQPVMPPAPFSARYTGELHIAEPGTYRLRIEADDGARLTLDGEVVAEGLTPGQPNSLETTMALGAGDHPIQIDYFQQGGGTSLRFLWSINDGPLTPVPPSALIPAAP
jgi:hypothetical protein